MPGNDHPMSGSKLAKDWSKPGKDQIKWLRTGQQPVDSLENIIENATNYIATIPIP